MRTVFEGNPVCELFSIYELLTTWEWIIPSKSLAIVFVYEEQVARILNEQSSPINFVTFTEPQKFLTQ